MRNKKPALTVEQHRKVASLLAICEHCDSEILKIISHLRKCDKHHSRMSDGIIGLKSALEDLLFTDNPKDPTIGTGFYYGLPIRGGGGIFSHLISMLKQDPQFMKALAAHFDEDHS
jgi:hypothetical protein